MNHKIENKQKKSSLETITKDQITKHSQNIPLSQDYLKIEKTTIYRKS